VADGRKVGGVTYREAGADYFDQRKLRRHAGVWSLWALGVAAVISGDFFGWNFGLAYGFGGLLVATIIVTVMYFGLCYSISEMSPALPHTGGAYSFARSAMGPWGGFTTGVAETIEYVITVAACEMRSELYHGAGIPNGDITTLTARAAYERAGLGPEDIDLVQIHDAFSVEEIEYYESLGFAPEGEGEKLIAEGATEIGGRIPFSTDGGLLSRGHPIGPTGLAQVWETVQQLRGTAGQRQVEGARVGLLHMIGAGGVCFCTVLKR